MDLSAFARNSARLTSAGGSTTNPSPPPPSPTPPHTSTPYCGPLLLQMPIENDRSNNRRLSNGDAEIIHTNMNGKVPVIEQVCLKHCL